VTTKKIQICYPGQDVWEFDVPEDCTLESIFAMFNKGSGRECKDFREQKMRSLSVGDFVKFEGTWIKCDSFGWSEVKDVDVIVACCTRNPFKPKFF